MSKIIDELSRLDVLSLLEKNDFVIDAYRRIQEINAQLTSVTEGSGVPTYIATKHAWYFDTATSKYYRNTDGGATWVALN